ncbi:MAG: LutB/LldF family L-lactate oxidation iron-sulfur protein [Bacteroidales bacterium]
MNDIYNRFQKNSARKAFDLEHRSKINFNISKYNAAVGRGKAIFSDLELARKRASNIRHRVVNSLDKYLIDFAANFEKNGGELHWATDADEAVSFVLSVLEKHGISLVVKSKSMITEELELNRHIESKDIEVVETDLGEYIVQLSGEKPYHIVTPAMHKSKEDIAALFSEKLNTPPDSTPEELTAAVREVLRKKFFDAGAGITGANFLIADTGSVAITENEGNAMMSFSFPKVHIAIAGIEKIIPSLEDLDLFWPLLATHGTGQHVTVYNSIISGPRAENEVDGPEYFYLVLLENNRSEVLKKPLQRAAMKCIKCGACLNACPIYRNIGGHTYETTYTGPIGSVITPLMRGMDWFGHLSFASSLCGKCTEVCPVKIPLHELLLYNRNDFVKNGHSRLSEKVSMNAMKYALKSDKRLERFSPVIKNTGMQLVFKNGWGKMRSLPRFAPKSFRALWNERNKEQ